MRYRLALRGDRGRSATGDAVSAAELIAARSPRPTPPRAAIAARRPGGAALMAAFAAPIDLAAWTLTAAAPVVVPRDLRYAGTPLAALRAERATPGPVRAPAAGRRCARSSRRPARSPAGRSSSSRPTRSRCGGSRRRSRSALPTFYLVLDAGGTLAPFAAGDIVPAGAPVATATGVTILCAGQDRIARDPALWSAQIAAAIASAGADAGTWPAFAAAVAAQTASGPNPPVLLLDHTGAPLRDADVADQRRLADAPSRG